MSNNKSEIPAELLPKEIGEVMKQADTQVYRQFIKETEGKNPVVVDPRKDEKTRMQLPDTD